MLRPTALFCALGALAAAPEASADRIYRYVDEDGVVVLTNIGPGGTRRASRQDAVRAVRYLRARSNGEYDAYVDEACELYQIPRALVRAVIAAESAFNPLAVSHKGAMGLMQLMPKTAAEMFVSDAFDPRQNILGGVRYLRVLANMFEGDLIRIVAAYNAGPEAVRRAGGVPPYAETQEYVRRVLRFYDAFKDDEEQDA